MARHGDIEQIAKSRLYATYKRLSLNTANTTSENIMKHFKVTVQYLNGTDFVYECDAESNWQAAALARIQGRRLGFGGAMDVKETITEEA